MKCCNEAPDPKNGIVGGAANVAMGGKFGDGFLSAAASAGLADAGAYGFFKGTSAGAIAGRTTMAGVVGGTASVLGGGKFANGAYTAAFQHLLNYEADAWKAGAQWLAGSDLTGRGNTKYVWSGDAMAEELLKTPEVGEAMLKATISGKPVYFKRNAGIEPVGSYLKGFFTDLFRDNPTRALHGSFDGVVTPFPHGLRIQAADTLGWESFTREPPRVSRLLGMDKMGLWTVKSYETNFLVSNDKFGSGGVGGNLSVKYDIFKNFK